MKVNNLEEHINTYTRKVLFEKTSYDIIHKMKRDTTNKSYPIFLMMLQQLKDEGRVIIDGGVNSGIYWVTTINAH